MYSRLSQHLNVNQILTLEQYGFQKNSNTKAAVCTGNILKALNEHRQTVGIFSDIARAFHSVNHNILPDKLCHYGIHGTALLWFRSFLEKTKS